MRAVESDFAAIAEVEGVQLRSIACRYEKSPFGWLWTVVVQLYRVRDRAMWSIQEKAPLLTEAVIAIRRRVEAESKSPEN